MTTRGAPVLHRAREALARRAWVEAARLFREIDPATLAASDLEAMADALWWCSELDESVRIRTKAYNASLAEGNVRRAGFNAWFLAYDFLFKGAVSLSDGWIQHARRLLADEAPCEEQGYLLLHDAWASLEAGVSDGAETHARAALAHGERFKADGLVALALQTIGSALVARGEITDGCRMLDEAMTAVIAGRIGPLFTGWVYCNVLTTCLKLADLRRAGEWARAATAWCDSLDGTTPYHGLCRIYRVELEVFLGDWDAAITQARRAAEEVTPVAPVVAGAAFYALGEVHRLRGDLDAAEAAYARAHALGRDPQPGLALVRLAQGKFDAAAAGLRLQLEMPHENTLERARLLEAHAEVALAAGDLAAARGALAGIRTIASATGGSVFDAMALFAEGRITLAEGREDDAIAAARGAWERWQSMALPYEAARARVVLARASRRAGDEDRARLELAAAREAFVRLGAVPDVREIDGLVAPTRPGGLSEREVEVLRLVTVGHTNREIATALTLSEHTVSRHLQNIFSKLDVNSRAAASAYAVQHDLA